MSSQRDVLSLQVILTTWLLAAGAFPAALVLAAAGQGLGAIAGGCQWIGVSLPLDRAVWALVNEPTIRFAATDAAIGYWLGSWLLPLVAALGSVGLLPRPRTVGAELAVVQFAWAASVAGVAAQPVLGHGASHAAQWLALHRLPDQLVWLGPAAAASVALVPTLRLLAVAREGRRALRRVARIGVVIVHLVVPAVGWGLLVFAAGERSWTLSVVVAAPSVAALGTAFYGLPPRLGNRLGPIGASTVAAALITALVVWGVIAFAGAPRGQQRRSGVLWSEPNARNNIRGWVDPRPLPWVDRYRPLPSRSEP